MDQAASGKANEFGVTNYVVLCVIIAVNGLIAGFFTWKDCTTKGFLHAGGNQHVLAVGVSLTLSFISGVTVLDSPTEMYAFNSNYILQTIGMFLGLVIAAGVFIPLLHRNGVTSIFEYLEVRFSAPVRFLGAIFMIIQMLVYMAYVLYIPCKAVSAVTGFHVDACIAGFGACVIIYTALGGIKGVVWTDVFQFMVILAGLLAIFIKGIMEVGGFKAAWDIADMRGRIKLDDFSFDPTLRHSILSLVVGGCFFWLGLYGTNQGQVQKTLTTSSPTKAAVSVLISVPLLMILNIIICLIGIVMFAYYEKCDPKTAGIVSEFDQIPTLFSMHMFHDMEGVPGLFVACVFSASLSSISVGLTSISTVIYTDFVKRCSNVNEKVANISLRLIVAIVGVAVIGLGFLASEIEEARENALTVFRILNGPILGLFVLGIFFPCANSIGAFVGSVCGGALVAWFGIGRYVEDIKSEQSMFMSTASCNFTVPVRPPFVMNPEYGGVDKVYTISYMYYTLISLATVIVVGLLVSFLTCYTKASHLKAVYVLPIFSMLVRHPEEETKPGDEPETVENNVDAPANDISPNENADETPTKLESFETD